MRTITAAILVMVGLVAAGCGATTRSTTVSTAVSPALTSATVVFVSRDHGKDADSLLTMQLLRNNAELAAESRVIGTKFDDDSTSNPPRVRRYRTLHHAGHRRWSLATSPDA